MLAIAIVVDDAIVVVEAVHAKLDEGYTSARMAAIDAMREIGGAIVSITLVMMLVFIPVSFMSGTSGVFYRQFGLTMAIAIGLSALNALTLSPALCAVFLKPHKADGGSKKVSFVKAFHEGFNRNYEKLLVRYKKWAGFFINHKITAFGVVAASIVALAAMMMTTSTALVPNEDTGVLFCMVNMPPATSLDKTEATLAKVDKILAANPAVESRTEILGYSFIAGQGNTYGTFIIKLKDWSEREKGQDATSVLGQLYGAVGQQIKDATVMMFQPPMISGYSVTSGFELQLQDKTGGDINKFFQIYQQFIGALNQRPEIQQAYSTFNPTFPQYMVNVDVAKTSPSVVLSTLQGYYGGMYVSNFNRFGKLYRVMMQADPSARISPETLNQVKVRVGNEMSPITNFITLERVYGPDIISRFNLFTSISVSGTPNPGYSNGDAIKAIQEVAAQTLPMGYGYEFSGMTREEQNSSAASTAIVFGLCLLFVYLLLSAQYESYILPLSVILSIPLGLMGSFLFAKIFGVNNNIYLQIGSLGTGAVGGMLIGMILQVLIVPALFVAFQKIQEKIQPLKWKDTDNAEIDDQIEQYSRN